MYTSLQLFEPSKMPCHTGTWQNVAPAGWNCVLEIGKRAWTMRALDCRHAEKKAVLMSETVQDRDVVTANH